MTEIPPLTLFHAVLLFSTAFIASGLNAIAWEQAFLMAMGGLLGGYASAYYARKLNPLWVLSQAHPKI